MPRKSSRKTAARSTDKPRRPTRDQIPNAGGIYRFDPDAEAGTDPISVVEPATGSEPPADDTPTNDNPE